MGKYVMTNKMKNGATAPSGGVVKTKNGKPIKKEPAKKGGK